MSKLILPTLRRFIRERFGSNTLKEFDVFANTIDEPNMVQNLKDYAWSLVYDLDCNANTIHLSDVVKYWYSEVMDVITQDNPSKITWVN